MSIEPPKDLAVILENFNRNPGLGGLFLYEGQGEQSMFEALSRMQGQNLKEIWLFIGSEGGFSEREVQLFQSVNMTPISLGEQVLRVETACLAAASIIKYELNLF